MENKFTGNFFAKIWKFAKTKWGIAAAIVLVIFLGWLIFHKNKSTTNFIKVERGSITEAVEVTGNTTPIESVSLGFENGGSIAHVYSDVGNSVYAGQVLAELNVADLSAQLAQAKANVDTQKAKLTGLQSGAQPEDIASSKAALDKSQQDLLNMYASIADNLNDGYSKANDAVRTQLNNFFSNADTSSPQINFSTSNTQAATNAKSERGAISTTLNDWQNELLGIGSYSSPTSLDQALQDGLSDLSSVRQLLADVSAVLNGASSLDSTTLLTYKTNVTSAISEINTATKNLNTVMQNISSQKLTVAQAQAQLALKQAGATQNDIDAQEAQVEQAEANVLSVQAKLQNSRIISPIDGTVTQFDAKVGQIATPGQVLVSVISNNRFEVDAQVPETDIGKVAVDNNVDMTFDAFPNEHFGGKIFYIDPAETITSGVVNYKVKVSFAGLDSRMKSGLTANLTIETRTHDNALILPQYAILQNDQGTFVQAMINGKASTTPVALGLQDQNGNVEIISGVTEGEEVMNIGLKQ